MYGGERVRSEEHHPNCEARRWQHHVVRVLYWNRHWLHPKVDSIMRKEDILNYTEATNKNIRQKAETEPFSRTMMLSKPPKL